MDLENSNQAKLLNPSVRHCSKVDLRRILNFSIAKLAILSSYLDFRNLQNPIFWSTKSRFRSNKFSFSRISRVSYILDTEFPIY